MSYDFSFSKKTFSFALAGFVFVGLMLFIGGLLVGTNWKAEPKAPAVVAANPPAVAPVPEPSSAPQQPVMRADVAIPKAAPPGEVITLSETSEPIKQAHASAPSVTRKSAQPFPSAPANDGELKIIREADRSEEDAGETPTFSVQVGVFTAKNDANQLVRLLQSRGYAPIVLTANDDDDRVLYAVRIGAYANKAEAIDAASTFTRQEKIQTIVRPLASL